MTKSVSGQGLFYTYVEDNKQGRRTFQLLGREWDLLPDVYSPTYTYATAFYSSNIPFPLGGAMLEIGCGAGVTAVQAVLAGCSTVTAVDINPAAVENSRINAQRHHVESRVQVLQGSLFDALPADAAFDAIFWNAPYEDSDLDDAQSIVGPNLTRAYIDLEYQACQEYLAGARGRLRQGGRLYLGSGSCANLEKLHRLIARFDWHAHIVASGTGQPDDHIEHMLFELSQAPTS